MASILCGESVLQVELSGLERLGAVRASPVGAPRSAVTTARAVQNLWQELRGWRAPGTGVPWVLMLGTSRSRGYKDFNAVYGNRPGLVIELADQEFARWLVSMPLAAAEELAVELTTQPTA